MCIFSRLIYSTCCTSCTAQFASLANVTYPKPYEDFLKIVDTVNVDLGWMVSAGCIWSGIDFHDRLLFSTVGPLGVLVLLAVTFKIASARIQATSSGGTGAIARDPRNVHMSALLMLTFVVYSSVSSIVFRTFSCEMLDDGKEYLRGDYRIVCTDQKHRRFNTYAGMMIAVYPVGIPLFYAALLSQRRGMTATGVSNRSNCTPVADLWEAYRPERFYYEVRTGKAISHCCVIVPLNPLTSLTCLSGCVLTP